MMISIVTKETFAPVLESCNNGAYKEDFYYYYCVDGLNYNWKKEHDREACAEKNCDINLVEYWPFSNKQICEERWIKEEDFGQY